MSSGEEEQDEILEAIREQQNNIANKKKILLDVEHELESIAADIDHPQIKKLADGMSNLCIVLQNLYDHAEGLWVGGFLERKQLQILNDALMLVPEIANNTAAMNALEKAAIDFAQKYGNLKLTRDLLIVSRSSLFRSRSSLGDNILVIESAKVI
ncbi:MAG TPA: hypothetical protein VFZ55_02475 [Nitrososphaera sp.]